MDMSETSFMENVGYYIQCFALNKSSNKVIVAGRDVCKLYCIENGQFLYKSEYILSRSAMNVLCIMDICWSHLDESLVVSCGSNGELHKWTITESDKIVNETSFKSYHKRTINKVNFHPKTNQLISGDQDGHINLIDFRLKDNLVSTFKHDAEDKVTDLQFSPTLEHQFASGSESGHIFIWDTRNPLKFDKRFKPHMKGVHLDYHPEEKNWLATASKDKYIYVWDLMACQTPKYSLMHSDSIANIKWRPKRRTQIAACTSAIDARLYVWDLVRPYVPYASFDKYQNFMWRDTKVLVASAGNVLYNRSINDAIRPADHSTLVAVDVDKYGAIAFAVGDVGEDSHKVQTLIESNLNEPANSVNAGSFGSTTFFQSDQTSNDSEFSILKFRINKSKMIIDNNIINGKDWLVDAVKGYKFTNDSFENLCENNARVALFSNKISVYKDWNILKTLYKNDTSEIYNDGAKTFSLPLSNERTHNQTMRLDRRESNASSNSDGFHEAASSPENNEFSCEEYNNKNEEDDFILPSDIIEFNEVHELIDEYLNEKNHHQISNNMNNLNLANVQNNENSEVNDNDANYSKDFRLNILPKYHQPELLKFSFDKHFKNILFHYVEEENDLATAITMLLVAARSNKFQKSNIDEVYLNEWLFQYIELLSKFELWNLRVEIIKAAHEKVMSNSNLKFLEVMTNSINYSNMCGTCKKVIDGGSSCSKCNKNPFLCSFCHVAVKDLYLWCHVCCHGGHVNHVNDWFQKYNTCPSGCGCNCWGY